MRVHSGVALRVRGAHTLALRCVGARCALCAPQPKPTPQRTTQFQVDRVRLLLSQEGVAASLTPNVTALTAPGEAVAVAVRGVRAPLPTDVVAAYAAPSDAARVVPLAWRSVASGSPQYLETGDGSVT